MRWIAILVVMVFLMPARGMAGPAWIVWDSQLQSTGGSLLSIDGADVRIRDMRGLETEVKDAVALVRRPAEARDFAFEGRASGRWRALVRLTDGQVWEAELVGTDEEDRLSLRVRWLGQVRVGLEFVDRITMRGLQGGETGDWHTSGDAVSAFEDVVMLGNGDEVRGTVLTIGRRVRVETGNGPVELNLSDVGEIRLVNARTDPPPVLVWVSTGSVLGARRLEGGGERSWSLEPVIPGVDGAPIRGRVTISGGEALLVGVEYAAGRIVPVARLPVRLHESGSGLRWSRKPRSSRGGSWLGLDDLLFPSPMVAEFELPRGAERVSGEFAAAESAGDWTDCVVEIEQDGRTLWKGRVTGDSEALRFNVPVSDREGLLIRILPGAYGPIQDRVLLKLGWVLGNELPGRP